MPVEGRDLSSRQTQYVVKDMEIGKPINSDKCSEAADGVARESVKSCPRAGCGKSAGPVVCPVKAGMFSRRQTCHREGSSTDSARHRFSSVDHPNRSSGLISLRSQP